MTITPNIIATTVLDENGGYDTFHDILVEFNVTGLSKESMKAIFMQIPIHITIEAISWGIDTVVRDSIFTYLKNHPNIIKSQL